MARAAREAFSKMGDEALEALITRQPMLLLVRGEDGRGALWWAWERGSTHILQLLSRVGFDILSDEVDANGVAPWTLGGERWERLADDARQLAAAAETKTLYLVRHGFSEAQAAARREGTARRDPRLRDAMLHAEGVLQATQLRAIAAEWGVEVVISSPLRRALHTAALAFGAQERGESWWHKIAEETEPPPLEISSGLREYPVDRPENIGVPPQELRRWLHGLPSLGPGHAAALCTTGQPCWDPDAEWALLQELSAPRTKQGAVSDLRELQDFCKAQASAFLKSALERKEGVIAIVSHFTLINHLVVPIVGLKANLGNCEAVRLRLARTARGWIAGPPEKLP